MAEARRTPPPPAPPDWVVDPRPFERAGDALAGAIVRVLEDGAESGGGEARGVRLAIPGGSALEAVQVARRRLGGDWARVRLTWVDERCVPMADAASNRGEAARGGLLSAGTASPAAEDASAPAPAGVLALFEDGETPAAAVQRVSRAWQADFAGALDVVCLGMGGDGHVASLFPGHPATQDRAAGARRPERAAGSEWVVHVPDSPKPPTDRISLTRAALASARSVVLVAAGVEKRDALARLADGDPTLPASGLPGLLVVTDQPGKPSGAGASGKHGAVCGPDGTRRGRTGGEEG